LDRNRIREKISLAFRGLMKMQERIWVVSPLIVPLPTVGVARAFNSFIYLLCALSCAAWLGFRRPLLINFFLMVPGLLKLWPWRSVYYLVDRWDAFSRYDSRVMSRMNRLSCANADCVIVSARDLYEDVRDLNPRTYLVPHGVDYEHFARRFVGEADNRLDVPADVPPGPKIGLIGLLDERVDQDLLRRLAQEIPQAQVLLVGKQDDISTDKLNDLANLHFLGPRPFRELPKYVASFTVGLIPYLVNEQTLSVNPIKLREMLAAGCPVVSTALPEVMSVRERLAGEIGGAGDELTRRTGIWIAHNHDEFIAQARYLVSQPLTWDERKAVSGLMSSETWSDKVHEILQLALRAQP
jgi:glycosyltransferase involved in cell wall biosynthesis